MQVTAEDGAQLAADGDFELAHVGGAVRAVAFLMGAVPRPRVPSRSVSGGRYVGADGRRSVPAGSHIVFVAILDHGHDEDDDEGQHGGDGRNGGNAERKQ